LSASKVLDSYAILCYLQKEPGHEAVVDLLEKASAESKPLLMSVVNWGEVIYRTTQRRGETEAVAVENVLNSFPIEVVDVDRDVTRHAAGFKAKHRMSYADCFAAALAKLKKAELVTGDPEFKQVEGEIKVRWL
jgi:ribonuclease VapC